MLLGRAGVRAGSPVKNATGLTGACVQKWVMGNPLSLALRLVLGAQSPGYVHSPVVTESPVGPTGGFQGPIFGWENLGVISQV